MKSKQGKTGDEVEEDEKRMGGKKGERANWGVVWPDRPRV